MTQKTAGTSSSRMSCSHTTHASTMCTPFENIYGRKARLPIDLKATKDYTVDTVLTQSDASPDILHTLTEIHDKLRSSVRSNIPLYTQEHQKCCFDRRHTPTHV